MNVERLPSKTDDLVRKEDDIEWQVTGRRRPTPHEDRGILNGN